jgi:hypothetical protein
MQKKLDESDAGKLLADNERLLAANKALLHQLTLFQYGELTTDQRKSTLDALKQQAAELKASGLVPTADQLAEHDARLDEKYGVYNELPGETPAQFEARKARALGVQQQKS